jgi:TatD DNase family protein
MKIADSHCHLHFEECQTGITGIIDRAYNAGVEHMLLVGIDPVDSLKAVNWSQTDTHMHAAVGIHPQYSKHYSKLDVAGLSAMINEKTVAIGETGFDLYREADSVMWQKEMFEEHINLAKELKLPLIIHDRQAHEETIGVLDEKGGWTTGGVMHCFSGNQEMALYVLSKGFYISITGVITYKNASVLREVAEIIPIEKLLVETDAPYLSPVPFRGKDNEPAYLLETIKELAKIKKMSIADIAEATCSNFEELFLSRKK